MILKISLRGANDAVLLGAGHTLGPGAKTRIRAVADFSKNETIAIFHDQIDFSPPAVVIPLDGPETAGMKKRLCRLLPVFSGLAVAIHTQTAGRLP